MIPARELAGTGITTSALGLGCAELYRQPSAPQRRRLMETAFGAGIRHFDAAPMYGLGLAERELGRFARGRRDAIVIVTKFGIAPTPAARAIGRVQGPIRRVLAASSGLSSKARGAAAGPGQGPAGSLLYRATGFDGAGVRRGLERSLRELGTDYVDLLLLHDPEPGQVRGDEVYAALEAARQTGKIRAWGVAGEPEPTMSVAREFQVAPPVLQLRDDLLEPAPSAGSDAGARITFGVLGRPLALILSHLSAGPERRRAWQEAVGVDCGDPIVLAGLVLRCAVATNPEGVVLFGSIRREHIERSAAALTDSEGDLGAFTRLVAAELVRPALARADA